MNVGYKKTNVYLLDIASLFSWIGVDGEDALSRRGHAGISAVRQESRDSTLGGRGSDGSRLKEEGYG